MISTKSKWQKFKTSGNYCRKLKKLRDDVKAASVAENKSVPRLATDKVVSSSSTGLQQQPCPSLVNYYSSSSSDDYESDREINFNLNMNVSSEDEDELSPDEHECFTIDIPSEVVDCGVSTETKKRETFQDFLRKWANNYSIHQNALKPLLQNLNHYFSAQLPKDPRTLMFTPAQSSLQIIPLSGGLYWHQGLEYCLRVCFATLDKPISIAINFNVDGLPLYNSSRDQFWPILFNIYEMPHIPAMIIALFYGKNKPQKVEEYIQQFVTELNGILEAGGLTINGFLLSITIRAFICDSPARAMLKGKNTN